jgi:hypothetical protein
MPGRCVLREVAGVPFQLHSPPYYV